MRVFLISFVAFLVAPLGNLLGFLWFDFFRIRRKVAIQNVGIAFPALSFREQTRIARASVYHMGQTLIEFLFFPLFEKEDFEHFFEIQGSEHVEAALAEKRGVFFLSLHIGNGDFSTAAVSRRGWPVSLISKNFKSKWLNDVWFRMRTRHGTEFISPEKSSFEILRAIKRQRIVIFVLDQYMGPPVGCRTKFFGKETGTAMGLAVMVERTGCPVIPVTTYRKPNGHHVISFESPIPWAPLDVGPSRDEPAAENSGKNQARDANIRAMTQVYTDKIEDIVRKHPEQWMWIHRRWKNFG
jgi:KDO2-lipid IV(A) lauroyltransferase